MARTEQRPRRRHVLMREWRVMTAQPDREELPELLRSHLHEGLGHNNLLLTTCGLRPTAMAVARPGEAMGE